MKDWGFEREVNILEAAKVDKIIDVSRGIPFRRRWTSLLEGKEKMDSLPLISHGSYIHLPLSAAVEVQIPASGRNYPGPH